MTKKKTVGKDDPAPKDDLKGLAKLWNKKYPDKQVNLSDLTKKQSKKKK